MSDNILRQCRVSIFIEAIYLAFFPLKSLSGGKKGIEEKGGEGILLSSIKML